MDLRWGIIGFGKHARQKKLPAMEDAAHTQLKAISTRSKENVARLVREFPHLDVHASYEALLADSQIDAVYIGVPNHLHKEWTIKALAAGKHVLCDKPIGLNLEEALEMRKAAQQAKRTLREAFMYRFHPQHKEVRRLIAEGLIGEVRLFEAHFHLTMDDYQNIRLQKDCGGGGLYDVGCYVVDASRYILGETLLGHEAKSLSATWHIDPKSGVDDSCFIQLLYENGVAAHLSCGCRFGWSNQYAVYGTKGRIVLSPAFTIPRTKPGLILLEIEGEKAQRIRIDPCNQYAAEFESFAALVAGEDVAEEFKGDGVETMKILDAIRLSATSNTTIEL